MAKLDAAALKKLSDSDFAYIDSDGGRHLPIHDAEHTRNAMARFNQTQFESDAKKKTARSKILAAAKKFGIDVSNFANNPLTDIFDELTKKLKGKAEMSNVTLDATFAVESEEEDGDDLVLSGKLFRSGDYPDKNFSLTPLEMHRAIEQFVAPKYMNLHHQRPLFKSLDGEELDLTGEFGVIEDIWTDDGGEWLKAKVRKPKWLHQFCPEQKVSAEFSYATKDLKAAAWTHDPRVPEAELVAAFANSRHNTQNGQIALQQIHDMSASSGAVCDRSAAMASKHEATAIQRVHDMTVSHGATCQSMQPGQSMPAMYSNDQLPRRKRMNMKEFLLGKAKEEGFEVDENDPMFAKDDSKVSALEAKLAAQEAENTRLREAQEAHAATFARLETERRESAAATFAKDQVIAGRISPAAQEPLAALTVRILAADSTATFAEGEKSNTVLLKEVLDALESDFKVFTKNTVGDDAGPFAALFAETKTKGVGEEELNQDRINRMLAATPYGRDILKEKNGKTN